MKAARIAAFHAAPSIETLPDPVPRPARSIVRMAAATVGHIDRTVWGGKFFQHPPFPYVPGVEAAGVVVHSEVHAPGQRVWLRGAGLGIATDGTWCELIDAPDAALGPLPDAIDFALGAAFFSPSTSAWVALHEIGRVRPGERVRVNGASGAVGSLAVQLAREAGAVVLDAIPAPADKADGSGRASAASVEPAASAEPADLLIDTVGGAPLEAALPHVAPGGRAVLVGYTAGNAITLDLAHFLQRDVQLLPLNMHRRDRAGRAAVPALLQRFADGRLSLPVTRFALEDAAQAMAWIAQRGHRGRAVLVPGA